MKRVFAGGAGKIYTAYQYRGGETDRDISNDCGGSKGNLTGLAVKSKVSNLMYLHVGDG